MDRRHHSRPRHLMVMIVVFAAVGCGPVGAAQTIGTSSREGVPAQVTSQTPGDSGFLAKGLKAPPNLYTVIAPKMVADLFTLEPTPTTSLPRRSGARVSPRHRVPR